MASSTLVTAAPENIASAVDTAIGASTAANIKITKISNQGDTVHVLVTDFT